MLPMTFVIHSISYFVGRWELRLLEIGLCSFQSRYLAQRKHLKSILLRKKWVNVLTTTTKNWSISWFHFHWIPYETQSVQHLTKFGIFSLQRSFNWMVSICILWKWNQEIDKSFGVVNTSTYVWWSSFNSNAFKVKTTFFVSKSHISP